MSKEEKKETKPKVVLGDDFDLKAYAEVRCFLVFFSFFLFFVFSFF
jgi:hypothetical protein